MSWPALTTSLWVVISLILGLAPLNLTYGSSADLLKYDLQQAREKSPLEQVLAAALINRNQPRAVMKEAIEEEGRQIVHGLEYFLGALATIAAISPLLGLLGTVVGMIDVFAAIVTAGVGNPGVLAGGISKALITTAAGLSVAIPALIFHEILSSRVDQLILDMEDKAVQMVDVLHQGNIQ